MIFKHEISATESRSWRLLRNLFLLGAIQMACAASGSSEHFTQDRFVIGFWVPPRTQVDLPARYQEIADAHFNLVVGNSGTNVLRQLQICESLGLKALVEADPKITAKSPACWGYLLSDEPPTSAFASLAEQSEKIRQQHPGKFGYINLFPNYASTGQLGTATYEDYVARFVDQVKPEVLSMDHYPLMRPDMDSRKAYCDNLETMRRHSLRAQIPFWNYFQSMPFANHPDPTEAQIRWQINASLAYGAKGVLYFCYWTPGKGNGGTGEFPKGGAILTAEGRRTRHYDEARRINRELQHLGPTLMRLTSTGVHRIHTGQNPENLPQECGLRSLCRIGDDPHSEFLVGTFVHANGERAVLLVNDSTAFSAWTTVSWTTSSVREVDKSTGRLEAVVDDSPELGELQLSFGPGEGRLFLLPTKSR